MTVTSARDTHKASFVLDRDRETATEEIQMAAAEGYVEATI